MELDEIRQRLATVEGTLTRSGLDLWESLGNLERSPSAACIQVGVVVEQMLRDLWKRLKLKGPPEKLQFEDLVTLTTKKLDEEGMAMPVEVLTDIRVIQSRRNQAAHFWKASRRDAEYVLGCLANVTSWYFVEFLPSREGGIEAPVPRGGGSTVALLETAFEEEPISPAAGAEGGHAIGPADMPAVTEIVAPTESGLQPSGAGPNPGTSAEDQDGTSLGGGVGVRLPGRNDNAVQLW
jgi:hypothetical protein